MNIAFRSPLLIPLLSLWSLALAATYCLHSKHETDSKVLRQLASDAFAREVKLVALQVEERISRSSKPVSGPTTLPLTIGAPGEYAWIDEHKAIQHASRGEATGMQAETYLGPDALSQISQLRPGGEPITWLAENRLVGAYTVSIHTPGEPPTLVVIGDDLSSKLSTPTRTYRIFLVILAVATGLLSAILYLHASRRLNFPLARISKAISRFGAGESDARTEMDGDDAIGRLGRRFDEMANRIALERRHLAESEERLKFALHGSNAGIWDWQLESGHIYYSPRWKSLLGFAEDELLAHAEEWLKRVHPDDLPRVMELLDAHLSGQNEFFESEHRLRRKDNSYLWVLERGTAIRDNGRAYRMVGALTDITRRKEAESALQNSEEAYRSVVEGVTQVIFRADELGNFTFLNPAWAELTGFPADTSLSRPLNDFILADDRAAIQKLLQALVNGTSDKVEGEFRLLSNTNKARWFSLHARTLHEANGRAGVAGVLTDIDAQKSAQDALSLSNTKRKLILDLSPDGFVFIDRLGKVEYVNPAFLAMTGLTAGDLEGADLAELENRLSPLCSPQTPLPYFGSASNAREQMLTLQKPGKMILKWRMRTIGDELGDPQVSVLYFRDVTRETEVDQMKTEFLSTAAHELRTPMASIFGFSELLLARQYDAATQRDLIQTIHRQTKNLIDLVNELLDLARIEARGGKTFKIEEQDLAPLVITATSALYLPTDTHRMEVVLPEDLPRVKVDADKFRQCLANILSNAFKYSPGGGLIHVSTKRRSLRNREQIGISVRDSGMGMTPEQASRIFERFYRANSASGIPGTGLGMALVKEIMNIFGGEVAVDSTPGQGTEVTLWLEAVPPASNHRDSE